MSGKNVDKKLVKIIDNFYINVVDDFKEAEGIIINDSKFSSMFRKKDYDRNIRKLRDCKKKCISINVDGISDDNDKVKERMLKDFERARYAFITVCDAHIQLQSNLKSKSEGAKIKYSEYKEFYNRLQKAKNDLNSQLHELDIDYTDYTYDETESPYEFLSYSDINK